MEFDMDYLLIMKDAYLQYDIETDEFVIAYKPIFNLPVPLKEARKVSKKIEMGLEEKIEKYFIILDKRNDIIPELFDEKYKLLCYYKLKIKE